MPANPKPHLNRTVQQGVLVLTIAEPQLQGDGLISALGHELDQALTQSETGGVVLDFRHVQSLSSAAFRPLIRLRRAVQDKGGRLVLCNLSRTLADSFRATRMVSSSRSSSATFEAQPDLPTAVASLKPAAPEE